MIKMKKNIGVSFIKVKLLLTDQSSSYIQSPYLLVHSCETFPLDHNIFIVQCILPRSISFAFLFHRYVFFQFQLTIVIDISLFLSFFLTFLSSSWKGLLNSRHRPRRRRLQPSSWRGVVKPSALAVVVLEPVSLPSNLTTIYHHP